MEKIVEQEGIYIEEEAKEYLLRFSNHSIRELMNHLEKIYILDKGAADKPVSLEMCKKLCTSISFYQFETYIKKLKSGNLIDSVYILYEIHDYGYSVIDILDYFFIFIKTTDMLSEDEKYSIIPLLCKYITIFHSIHENIIELALITKDIYKILRRESALSTGNPVNL
jgi:DNA polymerase III gamma/tau subunit